MYREGLEHLYGKTISQLERIKELTQHCAGGWEFIDKSQLSQIDEYIKNGKKEDTKDSILPYQSELNYPHEKLYSELNEMIKLIHDI